MYIKAFLTSNFTKNTVFWENVKQTFLENNCDKLQNNFELEKYAKIAWNSS